MNSNVSANEKNLHSSCNRILKDIRTEKRDSFYDVKGIRPVSIRPNTATLVQLCTIRVVWQWQWRSATWLPQPSLEVFSARAKFKPKTCKQLSTLVFDVMVPPTPLLPESIMSTQASAAYRIDGYPYSFLRGLRLHKCFLFVTVDPRRFTILLQFKIPNPDSDMYGQCRLFTTFLIIQTERVGLRNELVFAIYRSAQAATVKPGSLAWARLRGLVAYGSWEFSNVIVDKPDADANLVYRHLDLAQFLYLSVSVSVLNRTALSIYELVLLASKLVFFRCEGDSIPIAKKVAPQSRTYSEVYGDLNSGWFC
ncbi:hypothetical protein F5877DRAFT_63561 [Lentinula edodes]|nr:hypothetical protein F5877DRAFT_63561 [Lentinula edodes]